MHAQTETAIADSAAKVLAAQAELMVTMTMPAAVSCLGEGLAALSEPIDAALQRVGPPIRQVSSRNLCKR